MGHLAKKKHPRRVPTAHFAQLQRLHESTLLVPHGEDDRELGTPVFLRGDVGGAVCSSVVCLALLGGRWLAAGVVVCGHLSWCG